MEAYRLRYDRTLNEDVLQIHKLELRDIERITVMKTYRDRFALMAFTKAGGVYHLTRRLFPTRAEVWEYFTEHFPEAVETTRSIVMENSD